MILAVARLQQETSGFVATVVGAQDRIEWRRSGCVACRVDHPAVSDSNIGTDQR
jgi:hypothetical protein